MATSSARIQPGRALTTTGCTLIAVLAGALACAWPVYESPATSGASVQQPVPSPSPSPSPPVTPSPSATVPPTPAAPPVVKVPRAVKKPDGTGGTALSLDARTKVATGGKTGWVNSRSVQPTRPPVVYRYVEKGLLAYASPTSSSVAAVFPVVLGQWLTPSRATSPGHLPVHGRAATAQPCQRALQEPLPLPPIF